MAEAAPQGPTAGSSDAAPPSRKPRRWLLRGFISLLILLIVAELVLRFVLGLGRPLLYQADASCGYLAKPDQHIYRFFCHNDINAVGMRSAPIISPKPKDEFRLMMLGDSVLYSMTHVDQSKIATSILAHELPGQLHRQVEVLNASAGGWAVENEVGYLRSRGTFNADAVIFILNAYDLTEPFNDLVPGTALTFPARNPPLALWEGWDRYLKPRLFHISTSDAGATEPAVSDPAAVTHKILNALDEAKKIAESRGARFGIVFSPVVGTNYQPVAPSVAGLQHLRDWTATEQVPMLDLGPAYASSPGKIIFFDGIHLNPGGQQIMAHSIENWPLIQQFAKQK